MDVQWIRRRKVGENDGKDLLYLKCVMHPLAGDAGRTKAYVKSSNVCGTRVGRCRDVDPGIPSRIANRGSVLHTSG